MGFPILVRLHLYIESGRRCRTEIIWCTHFFFHSSDYCLLRVPPQQWFTGPVFCLLLGVSSGCAWPITGQLTAVTWPVAEHSLSLLRGRDRKRALVIHKCNKYHVETNLFSFYRVWLIPILHLSLLHDCCHCIRQVSFHQVQENYLDSNPQALR